MYTKKSFLAQNVREAILSYNHRFQISHIGAIILVALFSFMVNIFWVNDSCLRSPADLALVYNKQYISPVVYGDGSFIIKFDDNIIDSSNTWVSDNNYCSTENAPPPGRFRILGNQIAFKSYSLFGNDDGIAFYRSYMFWCFIFLIISFTLIYKSLCLYISSTTSLGATLIVMTTPSIMFAFKYPILLTVNDLLGCLIVAIGLYATLLGRHIIAMFVVTIGVFCRETVMIIPLFGLLYSKRILIDRLICLLIPGMAWLAFRYYWSYDQSIIGYDVFGGWIYNTTYPAAAFGFLFTIFGYAWVMIGIGITNTYRNNNTNEFNTIIRSASVILVVVLAFHTICGRICETRITAFTFAPFAAFIIASSLRTLELVKTISKYWISYALTVCIAGVIAYTYFSVSLTESEYLWMSKVFDIFAIGIPAYHIEECFLISKQMIIHGWIGISIFYICCGLIVLPICYFTLPK